MDNNVIEDGSLTQLDLSYTQKRFWFIDQMEGEQSQYNLSTAIRLKGMLDISAFNSAFAQIVRRHEILRTTYKLDVQQIKPTVLPANLFVVSESAINKTYDEAEKFDLAQAINTEIKKPFDLAHDFMLRVQLVKLKVEDEEEQDRVAIVTMHHIAADAWSMKLLINEFRCFYIAKKNGQQSDLQALNVQYRDFANWQHQRLSSEKVIKQVDYWETLLRGAPPVHCLPLDKARPARSNFVGKSHRLEISKELTQGLRALAIKNRSTLFVVLESAFSVLLSRFTGQDDILFGVPFAGRTHKNWNNLIGCFINTLVFRLKVEQNESFAELLKKARNTNLDAMDNQDIPFEMLVDKLKPDRSLSYSPIYQILFSVAQYNKDELHLPDLELSLLNSDYSRVKVDLELELLETPDGIIVNWIYASGLFEAPTIKRFARYFEQILMHAVDKPDAHVAELSSLSASDHNLITKWNDTQVEFSNHTLLELIDKNWRDQPLHTAVIDGKRHISYSGLHAKANQLAHYMLSECKVKPGQFVGLCIERSAEMVIGLLAILKAGGAFVPLDPALPKQRLEYMLKDAQLELALVSPESYAKLEVDSIQLLEIVSIDTNVYPVTAPNVEVTAEQTAYMLYTSGSTGKPKGTLNAHQGISNRIQALQYQFILSPTDRVLQKTPITFDVSIGEIFWPLSFGCTLVLAHHEGHKDPHYLASLINEQSLTIAHFVPSMLEVFARVVGVAALKTLRLLMTSGEALSYELQKLVSAALPDTELVNQYGPTEAAIEVSYWHFNSLRPDHKVPIGKPAANVRLHILDQAQQLVPVGVEGELYIAGVQVAQGYLNLEELTEQRFIELDVMGRSERMYRTGDRVRWLEDGNIEYLGRLDNQVKLRGIRIELGEIESELRSSPYISGAIVTLSGTGSNQQLVAYLVLEKDLEDEQKHKFSIEKLQAGLRQVLPLHMVPTQVQLLDDLPVSANGKIDHKLLPAIQFESKAVKAPTSEIENILRQIWADELGRSINEIGVTDIFFEIGGNSLSVVPICAEISKVFKQNVLVADFFQYPSISLMRNFLENKQPAFRKMIDVDQRKKRIFDVRKKQKTN